MERPGSEPDRVSEGEVQVPDVEAAFRDGTPIDRAVGRAIREAILMHKRMGNPVAGSKDGKVVWIPPEQIRVDD
jgi:hypothetical protein